MKVGSALRGLRTLAVYSIYIGALVALVFGFMPQLAFLFNFIRILYTSIAILGFIVYSFRIYSTSIIYNRAENVCRSPNMLTINIVDIKRFNSYKETISNMILPLRIILTCIVVIFAIKGDYILLVAAESLFFLTIVFSKLIIAETNKSVDRAERIILKRKLAAQ